MTIPLKDIYPPYFQHYVNLVKGDVLTELTTQLSSINTLLTDLPDNKLQYAYDSDKWTIAEVMMHLIDSEIVFRYRMLAIARGESKNLPGYDQDIYLDHVDCSGMSKEFIINHFQSTRHETLNVIKTIASNRWASIGTMSQTKTSASSLPYIIAGHTLHHSQILLDRYL